MSNPIILVIALREERFKLPSKLFFFTDLDAVSVPSACFKMRFIFLLTERTASTSGALVDLILKFRFLYLTYSPLLS